MDLNKKKLADAVAKALEDKAKRKFTQSVELIINFQGIDFTKPEHRLNLDIVLPKGKGKVPKVGVFADGQIALDAKNSGAESVFDAAGVAKLAADAGELKRMLKEYEFIAQPNMMTVVAKSLGQVLGARGKLPRPIMGGTVADAIKMARSRVKLASKGKYLPVAQCLVGSEKMTPDDIAENIDSVLEKVKGKINESSIKSIYVKLSMGKPVKVTA